MSERFAISGVFNPSDKHAIRLKPKDGNCADYLLSKNKFNSSYNNNGFEKKAKNVSSF